MEFQSARFAGHPRLYAILNDSDPGTLKLKRGDQGADVAVVQQALFDLCWTLSLTPSVTDETQFVIGTFGPLTEQTVLNYKTHYDLLPAGAPPGTPYTGTVGPRTLEKLDHQCTLYDPSRANILAKADGLTAIGVVTVLSAFRPNPIVQQGTSGVSWSCTVQGEEGIVTDEASVGTFEIHGPLFEEYVNRGLMYGDLGYPCSDVIAMDDGTLRSDFEGGSLIYDPIGGGYTFYPAMA